MYQTQFLKPVSPQTEPVQVQDVVSQAMLLQIYFCRLNYIKCFVIVEGQLAALATSNYC